MSAVLEELWSALSAVLEWLGGSLLAVPEWLWGGDLSAVPEETWNAIASEKAYIGQFPMDTAEALDYEFYGVAGQDGEVGQEE